jgi:hypothetical protein
MRKVGVIAALVLGAVGALAIPSSALAVSDCSYASGTTVGPVTVYTDSGRTSDALVGACADTNTAIDGGYLEVGSGGPGSYAIVDGSDANSEPTGFGDGYIGVSTYESGASRDADCTNGPDQGATGSTNSGGCAGIDPAIPVVGGNYVAGVPVACGNTSGNDWASTSRDGCSIP